MAVARGLTITLGPTLNFNRGSFDFAVSTGFALNVYDWEASQDEVLTATSAGGTTTFALSSDRDHGVTFRPGVYLHGEAAYRLTEDLGIAGFARLDIAKSFDIGVGPTNYEIDPCGVTAGLMLRLTFLHPGQSVRFGVCALFPLTGGMTAVLRCRNGFLLSHPLSQNRDATPQMVSFLQEFQ